ncbi:AIPR family protein [Lacticaseibacillus nasuensis]|uniref:AIPR family protein n=1 Tax=Lacticaseibacillus nasuensis TaxID=944671 RepID=UPI0022454EFF|nr:AIPR family protein [Lacticaseibacillus nasuensis]MCX2456318.1 AIPR family protein [Lacticaseibacillus nasuensis]
MDTYREELVSDIKSLAATDTASDREAFFQIYCEKLDEAELIEDYEYLYFNGKGSRNRIIQIDGYAYNELDERLSLFVIPPLAYYQESSLTRTEADNLFTRAKMFYFQADNVIQNAEESSAGYGLARDIQSGRLSVRVLELIILTDAVKSTQIDSIPSEVVDGIRVDYTIFDITRMQQLDDTANAKEPVVIDLKADFNSDGIPMLPASKTDKYAAYLCNVPAVLLVRLYERYQSRLLEGNVRSFLQTRGKVNKGIRRTILTEPEMFFAYNNGIAATAETIKVEQTPSGPKIVGFTSLQIVNGGQTTVSLASAWSNDIKLESHKQIAKIYVPMKISVISPDAVQDLIPEIAKYANSQNKISDADLASNHKFHQQIEKLSRTILAPAVGGNQFGTHWYYERANGQYRQETYKLTPSARKQFEAQNPKAQMFRKVDLAKYINVYLEKPQKVSAGAQKNFTVFSDWMLKQWEKNENFANEDFFKQAVALAILFKQADYIVKNQTWYDSYKANIVAYTLAAIFHKVRESYKDLVVDFRQIWKNQRISQAWRDQIAVTAYLMYQHLINPNRTVENVTQWAKRDTAWQQAKAIDFDLNDAFVKELISKQYVATETQSAAREQKQQSEMDALVTVVNYGSAFWREVQAWGMEQKIWNVKDNSFLKLAIDMDTGKIPTDKQAVKILQVLEKARNESFPK